MTVDEAAQRLGISSASVRQLVARGKLPAHRPCLRRIVLDPADVEDYWRACRVGPVSVTPGPSHRLRVPRADWD